MFNMLKKLSIKLNIYKKYLKNISDQKIEIKYDLAIRYILDKVYNINCSLYTSSLNNIVLTIFSTKKRQKNKIKNAFIPESS